MTQLQLTPIFLLHKSAFLRVTENRYTRIYISKSKHTRQRSAVATQSFTPVSDLQETDISNLSQAHISKGDI